MSEEVLFQWLRQGTLMPDALLWREGFGEWQRADTLFAFPDRVPLATPLPVTPAVARTASIFETAVPESTVTEAARPQSAAPLTAVPQAPFTAAETEIPFIKDPLATSATARMTGRKPYKRRSESAKSAALVLLFIIALVLVPALVYVLMYQ
jgi:hypothetical protein